MQLRPLLSLPSASSKRRPLSPQVSRPSNPSIDLLQAIYDHAGIARNGNWGHFALFGERRRLCAATPRWQIYTLKPRLLSRLGNCCAGAHAIPSPPPKFRKWARVDLAAIASHPSRLRVSCTILTARSNFPVHLPAERLKTFDATRIDVLHYHFQRPTKQPSLKPPGIAAIDAAIGRANQSIAALVDRNFTTHCFGTTAMPHSRVRSAVGSRGEVLSQKKDLLRHAVTLFEAKTVMDIGCGDLEVAKDSALRLRRMGPIRGRGGNRAPEAT